MSRWLLEWRLKAYRHWLTMREPHWANITYGPIDYQSIHYYAAPKPKGTGPRASMRWIPMRSMFETGDLPGRAGAADRDSPWTRSWTAYRSRPLYQARLASWACVLVLLRGGAQPSQRFASISAPWCPADNFFAALNTGRSRTGRSASSPRGCALPDGALTTSASTRAQGQFERTLIVAEEGAYVSYRGLHGAHARRTSSMPRWSS